MIFNKNLNIFFSNKFLYTLNPELEVRSSTEYNFFITKFKNGFHAYFKPIKNITSTGNQSDNILFKVAEYLATNVLHNSQLKGYDSEKETITFRFKSWVDRKTKEKVFKEIKINVFDFMAKLLYFLPTTKKLCKFLSEHGLKLVEISYTAPKQVIA